jgi:hypothetical protein
MRLLVALAATRYAQRTLGQGGAGLRLRALAYSVADTVRCIIGAYGYGETPGDQGKFTLTLRRVHESLSHLVRLSHWSMKEGTSRLSAIDATSSASRQARSMRPSSPSIARRSISSFDAISTAKRCSAGAAVSRVPSAI